MSFKNISFFLSIFGFGFGRVFLGWLVGVFLGWCLFWIWRVFLCVYIIFYLFVWFFGSHVGKYILQECCWQWKKLLSQMQMFCQENRDCEGLPWHPVSTTWHDKHFCALWCSHAPFFRVVQPVLPLLLLSVRSYLQPRDKIHPRLQILQSWRQRVWWESGKQIKARMWLQNRSYSNKNKIEFLQNFWRRRQRNLTYQMVEPYHLITHLHHPYSCWFRPCPQHSSRPRTSLSPYCYIFCIDLLDVIFQSPPFGLLPNEMGYVFVLFIHLCLFHTIPNPFFLN